MRLNLQRKHKLGRRDTVQKRRRVRRDDDVPGKEDIHDGSWIEDMTFMGVETLMADTTVTEKALMEDMTFTRVQTLIDTTVTEDETSIDTTIKEDETLIGDTTITEDETLIEDIIFTEDETVMEDSHAKLEMGLP